MTAIKKTEAAKSSAAPAQFRKKPVVISALLWTGLNYVELAEFLNPGIAPKILGEEVSDPRPATIHTLEGDMRADVGDWIIRGVKGEFYPCKPEIFEATYEPADKPSAHQALYEALSAAANFNEHKNWCASLDAESMCTCGATKALLAARAALALADAAQEGEANG